VARVFGRFDREGSHPNNVLRGSGRGVGWMNIEGLMDGFIFVPSEICHYSFVSSKISVQINDVLAYRKPVQCHKLEFSVLSLWLEWQVGFKSGPSSNHEVSM